MDDNTFIEQDNREASIQKRKQTPRENGKGFLPIKTNAFDRVFISVVVLVAFHLLWMRFIEQYLPLEVATVITLVMAFFIIRRG